MCYLYIMESTTIYSLDCSNRNLEKLPENLPDTIEEINCRYNRIKELPEKLPIKLKYLNCSYNKLNKLPKNLPSNIVTLCIEFNKDLEDIPLESLPNLIHLYLDARQFVKFYKRIEDYIRENIKLQLHIIFLPNNNKKKDNQTERKIQDILYFSTRFELPKPILYNKNLSKTPNNIAERLKKNYNLTKVIRIDNQEAGSKTVKKNKNPKKINMKKSELQKIALKNKVSLKKRWNYEKER